MSKGLISVSTGTSNIPEAIPEWLVPKFREQLQEEHQQIGEGSTNSLTCDTVSKVCPSCLRRFRAKPIIIKKKKPATKKRPANKKQKKR